MKVTICDRMERRNTMEHRVFGGEWWEWGRRTPTTSAGTTEAADRHSATQHPVSVLFQLSVVRQLSPSEDVSPSCRDVDRLMARLRDLTISSGSLVLQQ
ncbi:hypothetical protein J6590_041846 [Homalodisca vitripennis]|nr:hypothetical protein J6590_041846 [Homalodisca vitripennis]